MDFNHQEIEKKWRSYWDDQKTYKVKEDPNKEKYYVLDMFPYPSGAGLHVGHPLGYIASDIFSRYKRLKGYNVLHPMGFDAFGLPAEEFAIQSGIHPAISTAENMERYKSQLNNLGFSFDWSREVVTCDPKYYKWTQWIFTLLFDHCYDKQKDKAVPISELKEHFSKQGTSNLPYDHSYEGQFSAEEWNNKSALAQSEVLTDFRLAYRKIGYVNWCEGLGTVLSNDQIVGGRSERGNHPVVQKAMTQWYLRTTAYAERLLKGLDGVDWSNSLKTIQTNWIGKSKGASIHFQVSDLDASIEIFTTRPDTIFGASFMVLAPKHDLVTKLVKAEQQEDIDKYIEYVNTKTELERMSEKKVTGAFTGSYAINPFTEKPIPIWIAEYVLKDYGTGAIMAVPSDDDRDNAFAEKFGIDIINVVDKSNVGDATRSSKEGTMINSGFLNGMSVMDAIDAAIAEVESRGIGQKKINYKLRDANFSRQRYWGEPFPIKYNSEGVPSLLELSELPLELPDTDDFKPGQGGESPLSRLQNWTNLPDDSRRETDVMPAVAGSSWYFLRYMDPNNENAFADKSKIDYWRDVDLYIGGAEHAVAHLLYARFWHKFLFDLGYVPTEEPFKRLINQGMIQGVIEYLYMYKEKQNGVTKFVCADIAKKGDDDAFVKMPIHVNFVNDYGSENSHLDINGIEQFLKWRPVYKDAEFVCSKGSYQNGKFNSTNGASDSFLLTQSEVGKMSKRWYNVINPDHVIEQYGADCFRMYEMFLGPIEQSKPWDIKGIEGVSKFLRRYWNLFHDDNQVFSITDEKASPAELKILHSTLAKVTHDIEAFSFNTAVSHFMVCVNELRKLACNKSEILEPLNRALAPFAPFMTEELWHKFGHSNSIHTSEYPICDETYLKEDSFDFPVCINGKKRAVLNISASLENKEIEEKALALPDIQKWLEGKSVRKVIIVPKRMINIVIA